MMTVVNRPVVPNVYSNLQRGRYSPLDIKYSKMYTVHVNPFSLSCPWESSSVKSPSGSRSWDI